MPRVVPSEGYQLYGRLLRPGVSDPAEMFKLTLSLPLIDCRTHIGISFEPTSIRMGANGQCIRPHQVATPILRLSR